MKWKPPENSCLKINVDAAARMENSGSGHGVVIRDYRGKVMAAKTSFSYLSFSPFAAEILAIKGDLSLLSWLASEILARI